MKFKWNNEECEVKVYRTTYDDGSLYVYLVDESGKFFLSLSFNIYDSKFIEDKSCAFVGLDNIFDVDRFIVKYGLGLSTGIVRNVGVQKFYLYKFNLDKIECKNL